MKQFLSKLKITKKELIAISIIMAAGLFLRLWQIELRTGFGYDQADIAFKAKEILEGDPVLLGPKTSIGSFSAGPLYIYLWALFGLFMGKDPAAGAYLSAFIGTFTIPIFYIATKEFFNKRAAFLSIVFVAFSYNIIFWDQTPWGPSLFYLSEAILLLGAYLSTKKAFGIIIASLGFSIGFHSHVAIFLNLLSVFVFWIFFRPKLRRKEMVISAGVILASLLPNIVWDLTHDFLNLKRILSVLASSQEGVPITLDRIFNFIYTQSVGTFYPFFSKMAALLIFLFFVGLCLKSILQDKKEKTVLILMLLSIFIPMFVFLFHKSTFTEYYLMMVIPAFIFIVSFFLDKLVVSKNLLWFLMAIFVIFNLRAWSRRIKPINLEAKKKIAREIKEVGGPNGYGVSFTTQPGMAFGFDYIFDFYGMNPDIPPKKGETKIFTVIIPSGYLDITNKVEYGGIGLRWEGFD